MANTTPSAAPPPEVLVEFLRLLQATVADYQETLVPVVRGSFLLQHWFGAEARPARDLDLECFEKPRSAPLSEAMQPYDRGHGENGEFESAVDLGKAMCRYAAQSSQDYQWRQPRPDPPEVEFQESDVPDDVVGASLWTYGTPGQRYYVGWTWRGRQQSTTGRLQIDVAQAGAYDVGDVGIHEIHLIAPGNQPFRFLAYTPEMLLAAKLSWLMRAWLMRNSTPVWNGEPKDLFDAHLLITRAPLRIDIFQKSFLAVAAEDKLDLNNLTPLLAAHTMTDADFPNWRNFAELHPPGPVPMLQTIADLLPALLGDLPQHVPFLLAIQAEPIDELPYLIYADWLDERADPRGRFLRHYSRLIFHEDEMSSKEITKNLKDLHADLEQASAPWLYHIIGVERFRDIRRSIEER